MRKAGIMPLPKRILIADDQRPARKGLHALLSLCSEVEVIGEAVDGQHAVNLAAERRPDVVLMDVRMPVMDGLEATRRIKSQTPQVKVVMLTLHAEFLNEALAAGADAFLVKGGSTEGLWAAIFNA
jgi:DNA-binding NarL/FixJ family response regulator